MSLTFSSQFLVLNESWMLFYVLLLHLLLLLVVKPDRRENGTG
jgi:hypothetical protein